jgi:hypothetical protein
VTSRTAAAGMLAEDDAPAIGTTLAELDAAAWSARVDPEAVQSLTRAALILNPDAADAIWARTEPAETGDGLLAIVEEHAAAVAELGRRACDLGETCEADRDTAVQAARDPDDPEAAAEARRVLADCEAAIETLTALAARLEEAWRALLRVPDEYGEYFETPLRLAADGGTLPWSGDFLTAGAA